MRRVTSVHGRGELLGEELMMRSDRSSGRMHEEWQLCSQDWSGVGLTGRRSSSIVSALDLLRPIAIVQCGDSVRACDQSEIRCHLDDLWGMDRSCTVSHTQVNFLRAYWVDSTIEGITDTYM